MQDITDMRVLINRLEEMGDIRTLPKMSFEIQRLRYARGKRE